MKPQRKLAVRRERLGDLQSADLREVVGGTHIPTDCGCLTHGYSCDACSVPTLPINACLNDLTSAFAHTIPCL